MDKTKGSTVGSSRVAARRGAKDLPPTQIASFALLAFQNGFFWQVVPCRARPKT
jgi:hypothetical protein